jgi:outer membrane immunogenic protein
LYRPRAARYAAGTEERGESMRKLARILVAAVVSGVAGVCAAQAADLPVKARPMAVVDPPFSWTGFYVGGFVGGLWGQKNWFEVAGPAPGGTINPDFSGVIGGVQGGYNYQFGRWVAGIEGEWGATNADGTSRCIATAAFTCGVDVKWVAMFTGRLGYTFFDRTLAYVKGGGVWMREDYPVAPGTPFAVTLSQTRDGWTIGGGVEYAFLPNWSVKAEYNYLDMGTDRLDFGGGAIEDITQKAHIAKVGINYRFSGWR